MFHWLQWMPLLYVDPILPFINNLGARVAHPSSELAAFVCIFPIWSNLISRPGPALSTDLIAAGLWNGVRESVRG